MHCILSSKGFIWSTACHTPGIAKLYGDTCSANLHTLSDLPRACCLMTLQDIPAGMPKWFTFDILTSSKNFFPSPLSLCHPLEIRIVISLQLGVTQQVLNMTLPPTSLQHLQVEKRWKKSEDHLFRMYLVPLVAVSNCLWVGDEAKPVAGCCNPSWCPLSHP